MNDKPPLDSPDDALRATDDFYRNQEGFGYDLGRVTEWLKRHVKIPISGRVLDLCCGDGIWSQGFQAINPALELYGIDISKGGIERERELVGLGDANFVVGDAEIDLPFPQEYFSLIFARGPGLFNQHDMAHSGAIGVLERWHQHLSSSGRFYSIFASVPERMGAYTPIADVVLPYNRVPRETSAVKFAGGKYHHSIESFHAPFWSAANVTVVSYSFVANQHILVSKRKTSEF